MKSWRRREGSQSGMPNLCTTSFIFTLSTPGVLFIARAPQGLHSALSERGLGFLLQELPSLTPRRCALPWTVPLSASRSLFYLKEILELATGLDRGRDGPAFSDVSTLNNYFSDSNMISVVGVTEHSGPADQPCLWAAKFYEHTVTSVTWSSTDLLPEVAKMVVYEHQHLWLKDTGFDVREPLISNPCSAIY